MEMKIIAILGIFGLALVGVVGDFFIKLASRESRPMVSSLFLIGVLIYALSAFGWVFVMQHVKLSTLGVFYALTTVLLLVFLGVIYFGERLEKYEIIGVVLGIISIILLVRYR